MYLPPSPTASSSWVQTLEGDLQALVQETPVTISSANNGFPFTFTTGLLTPAPSQRPSRASTPADFIFQGLPQIPEISSLVGTVAKSTSKTKTKTKSKARMRKPSKGAGGGDAPNPPINACPARGGQRMAVSWVGMSEAQTQGEQLDSVTNTIFMRVISDDVIARVLEGSLGSGFNSLLQGEYWNPSNAFTIDDLQSIAERIERTEQLQFGLQFISMMNQIQFLVKWTRLVSSGTCLLILSLIHLHSALSKPILGFMGVEGKWMKSWQPTYPPNSGQAFLNGVKQALALQG